MEELFFRHVTAKVTAWHTNDYHPSTLDEYYFLFGQLRQELAEKKITQSLEKSWASLPILARPLFFRLVVKTNSEKFVETLVREGLATADDFFPWIIRFGSPQLWDWFFFQRKDWSLKDWTISSKTIQELQAELAEEQKNHEDFKKHMPLLKKKIMEKEELDLNDPEVNTYRLLGGLMDVSMGHLVPIFSPYHSQYWEHHLRVRQKILNYILQ